MQALTSHGNLPLVRRLEAVGFRAWPAASVVYDGSWQVRLTGGHPSKRLNSVVPLDPSDSRDAVLRIEKARKRFEDYGRPLVIRETPLAPPQLIDCLADEGWQAFETSLVMIADLEGLELPEGLDHLPSHDIGRFIDALITVDQADPAIKPALAEIISAIKPATGLFIAENPGEAPQAVTICVQDNDLSGILSFCVAASRRRSGLGTEMLSAALRWARISGARTAWLQVVADNEPALALYRKFGFREAYRYRYWRQGDIL
ncbi:N-acetyltransferase [Rhizobium sp. SSA_523]|uniref:GNAT family N-acetyltransferase n=1 Tax=Rhizobium sp. SSA_523 TaxID=2952477 RepID=UPI0020919B21|nr:GNAT family N-acetyltransferase [Rhizobium sp. SSA_523]MCO5733699.1 GNAT family N-acetyltransferase [Rhizobium sp. SSA_523]WKC23011.1 GNAT family N-acetyltransferase [Rhizobium sp. SSA_523]